MVPNFLGHPVYEGIKLMHARSYRWYWEQTGAWKSLSRISRQSVRVLVQRGMFMLGSHGSVHWTGIMSHRGSTKSSVSSALYSPASVHWTGNTSSARSIKSSGGSPGRTCLSSLFVHCTGYGRRSSRRSVTYCEFSSLDGGTAAFRFQQNRLHLLPIWK